LAARRGLGIVASVFGVVVVLLVLVGAFLFFRAQELFRIDVRDGKQTVTRGHVPAGLLSDFGAAVRGVRRGRIVASKAQGGARVSFSGDIDAGVAQRLRNIFGTYPIARMRAPHLDKHQTLSDAFTLAWLVSILRNLFR
jgi:hypothetical protein